MVMKYCFIKDEETGLVQLGVGCPDEYYEEIGMVQRDVKQSDIDLQWYLSELCPMKTPEQKEQEEKERIQNLFITRSDFFDATIKAFMATEQVLHTAIESVLNTLHIDTVTKLLAINNFENAQHFYRKHTLFTLLSGVPIIIGNNEIIITSAQWDKFFDEADKRNPDAYKELLQGGE